MKKMYILFCVCISIQTVNAQKLVSKESGYTAKTKKQTVNAQKLVSKESGYTAKTKKQTVIEEKHPKIVTAFDGSKKVTTEAQVNHGDLDVRFVSKIVKNKTKISNDKGSLPIQTSNTEKIKGRKP